MKHMSLSDRQAFRREILGISGETEKRWADASRLVAGEVVNATGSVEMLLYGEVVDDTWSFLYSDDEAVILPSRVNRAIVAIRDEYEPGTKITARINSPGGDLWAGVSVASMLDDLGWDGYETETRVDGIAASAASIFQMSGKVITMDSLAQTMIHPPMTFVRGRMVNRAGIKAFIAELEKTDEKLAISGDGLVERYVERNRVNLPKNEIEPMFEAETWMIAKTAVEKGFADRVLEAPKTKAQESEDTESSPDNADLNRQMGKSAWNQLVIRADEVRRARSF